MRNDHKFSILDEVEPVQQKDISDDYLKDYITYKFYVKHQRYAPLPLLALQFFKVSWRAWRAYISDESGSNSL